MEAQEKRSFILALEEHRNLKSLRDGSGRAGTQGSAGPSENTASPPPPRPRPLPLRLRAPRPKPPRLAAPAVQIGSEAGQGANRARTSPPLPLTWDQGRPDRLGALNSRTLVQSTRTGSGRRGRRTRPRGATDSSRKWPRRLRGAAAQAVGTRPGRARCEKGRAASKEFASRDRWELVAGQRRPLGAFLAKCPETRIEAQALGAFSSALVTE